MSANTAFEAPQTLAHRITRMIHATGPISVAQFMAEANAHYYASRDPLGTAGDFTTAPEISQMFGELTGLCLADLWLRAGRRPNPYYVELGPGRGTLARDALRAMEQARLAPKVHLVETSPVLRERQSSLLPHARHHDDVEGLPADGPLLIVANEFFDALPIRQMVCTEGGWRERVVVPRDNREGEAFLPVAGDRAMDQAIPQPFLRSATPGDIVESCPAAAAIMFALASRIVRQGGCAIIIDYGYEGPSKGDTLQAVHRHRYADPYDMVGETDLTAHVDFSVLANIGRQAGLRVSGPIGQGAFLTSLGIDPRTQSLISATPERADELMRARERLVADNQMGKLFRVLALSHPDWPAPEGFS